MAVQYLTDICDIQYGFAFDASGFTPVAEEGMPLVRIRDVMNGRTETYFKGDFPKEYIIHKGDFLVGMDGEFNIAPWQSEDALLNQRVCRVESNQSGVSSKFLYWFLKKELKRIEDETPFVTVKHLSAKRLKQVKLDVPSLSQQESIASELDTLTDILDKKKQQLEELDKLAQSIFHDMFGDPICNEKGWPVKKLAEIADTFIGITYKPENVVDEGGTIVLRSSNVQQSELDFADIVRVNVPIKEKHYVRPGDILMCSRNGSFRLVGKVARIKQLPEEMSFGAFMTVIRSPHNDFLFAFFKSPAFRSQLTTAKTATINQITTKMLDAISVSLPPSNLQSEFAQKMEVIEKQKELVKCSIVETETLFNSRMDYWFN